MKRVTILIAWLLLIVTRLSLAQSRPARPVGEWLQFRGDRLYTGRSPLRGDIRSPAIAWKHFIGTRESYVAVTFGGVSASTVPLPREDVNGERRDELMRTWSAGAPWFDLDGDGKYTAIPDSAAHKIGGLLPGLPGMQQLSFRLLPQVGGKVHTCITTLSRREGKTWKPVWENDKLPSPYGIQPIVGDFDADGRIEYAVAVIDYVIIYDLATGDEKARVKFVQPGAESGRSYGWFGAFDLNRDGKSELILIGDFQEHLEVMGWRDGKLELIWGHLFEAQITGKQSLVRTGAEPVADVDGDGLPEITLSVFNEAGDDRWHTVSYDGMTGRVRHDLRDRCLAGLLDCDGDKASELFLTHAGASRFVPEVSRLEVVSLRGDSPKTRWQTDNAAFPMNGCRTFPLHINSGSSIWWFVTTELEEGKARAFFTRRVVNASTGEVEITCWQPQADGRIDNVGRVVGPRLEVRGSRAGRGVLIQATATIDGDAGITVSSGSATAEHSSLVSAPLSAPVVGALDPGSRPAVVVQDACEQLCAVRPNSVKGTAELLWRAPGRGQYLGQSLTGANTLFAGVTLADLFGDGRLATLTATRGPVGQARFVALDSHGKAIWKVDFDDLPGHVPPWNQAGITLWFAGRFTSRDRDDVLVNLRVSQDTWTAMLDGRTGKEIWRRKEIRMDAHRIESCGGLFTLTFDYDGDGLDDALIAFHDIIYVMKGSTGELLLLKDTAPGGVFGQRWAFGGNPVLADFFGNGTRSLLYWGAYPPRAVLDLKGNAVWIEDGQFSTYGMIPGVGDIDGDGRIEIIAPGQPGMEKKEDRAVRCYNAATSQWKWLLDIPSASGGANSPATADTDGDGRDECIFPIGKTLYAVGAAADGKAGEVRWSLPCPENLGPPAIADADGSGKPQIVVVCADGYVYGITNGAKTRP